nr:MAG TPA: hypothetical protein [Caudoviricetes sp.]
MFIFFENAQDNYDIEPMYFSEASSDSLTYIIKDELYPKIDAVLSTDQGKRNFNNIIGRYVSRNNDKLTTSGPQYLIPFTMKDKQEYFDLFSVSDTEVAALVDKITKQVNDKANWRLFKNNPIFFIFYCCIRYATLAKDAKLLNSALIAMALSVYPSIFAKYFRYEPNPNIMQYTIDNLSNRFIIKKSNHIFGTLTYSIQSSWKFHEKDFSRGADQDVIRFIQRIRNDQNSLLKKIANAYQTNYKKGLFVTTQVDAYDDNINVDNVNNTNKVETLSNKIVLSMLTNGVDLRIADFASNAAQVSKLDLRNYISLIINEKESETMKEFISSVLFLYLYTDSHEPDEIRSKEFIGYALQLFKKTNSKDKNVTNIKTTLDKWGTSSGIYRKFSRSATRVDYTKAIFMYFILSIQMYS